MPSRASPDTHIRTVKQLTIELFLCFVYVVETGDFEIKAPLLVSYKTSKPVQR